MQLQENITPTGFFAPQASDGYKNRLLLASVRNTALYMPRYTGDIAMSKAAGYASLHAVLAEAAGIYASGMVNVYCSVLKPLYEAFNAIYPGKYSYHRFARYMREAQKNDIFNIVVDHRGGNNKKISPMCKNWLFDLMRSGKKYGTPYMHRVICEYCERYGYAKPSLSWVKKNYYEMLPIAYKERYGADDFNYQHLPYAGIIPAEKRNEQWQIDGWRLPFYMDGWRTLTLFKVLDACSRKIVGYWVGDTENTETILKGLENAVQNTGVLPCEIVSDNHSFNQTKEAENFKELVAARGCTWTVTSNPRHKSLVERSFSTFGTCFCKDKRGYVGEGIRSRRKNARTTQEELDKYTRSGRFYSEDELKSLAAALVEEYNNTGINGHASPAEVYEATAENALPQSEADKVQLFIRRTEATVRRGQIDIVRSGIKHEYQLNAKNFVNINSQKVGVRYADYNLLYVYDLKTDEFICTVGQKEYAHGAIANQTQKDIDVLNRQKGRIEGIKKRYREQAEQIKRTAYAIDPYAAEAMNAKTTGKNVLEMMRANGKIQLEAARLGVDVGALTCVKAQSEISPMNFNRPGRRQKERERKPFTEEISVLEKITN